MNFTRREIEAKKKETEESFKWLINQLNRYKNSEYD